MTATREPVIIVGGGQSGLAAARAVRDAGMRPLVLEASDRPVGSWPLYYDSLKLFSPAQYSSMLGVAFPGDPDHYPHRDEVADYLERYAESLGVEIRTNTRVETVEARGASFVVHTADGQSISAAGLVAASGSFSNPHRPAFPGQESFTGELLHVADYRNPEPHVGKRIVVVGRGNSAVQVGYELSAVAEVTLATRAPVQFLDQVHGGRDLHYWLTTTGFDDIPPQWLAQIIAGTLVLDAGDYREALKSGRLEQRPMFAALDHDRVIWSNGAAESVDLVLLATGYRPRVDYLEGLGALDPDGAPLHSSGVSTTHPGLVYLGLELQRSFASNTLRGVARDAAFVIRPLAAHVRGAPAAVGL